MNTSDINLDDNLIGIAVGIRFRANFSIDDQLGRIVDTILYQKDSFFGPAFFQNVRTSLNKRTLLNEANGDHLTIDNSNIILDLATKKGGGTMEIKDAANVLSKFESQIILGIMKEFEIHEINRLGIVKNYLFQIEELAKVFIDKTIGRTLDGVNDINLSFSKKSPAQPALVDREIHDYNNAIFNVVKKADQNEIFMSIDYQKYFDPFLPAASEIKFNDFLKEAEIFNRDRYLPWIKSNYIQS